MYHLQDADIETSHANQLFHHLFMIGTNDTCIRLLLPGHLSQDSVNVPGTEDIT